MKIKYAFLDGTVTEVEVSDEIGAVIIDSRKAEHAQDERDLALFMDIVLLSKCAELWVFGEKITSGMSIEIEKAKRKGQLIRYFTETCEEVRR